MSSGTMMAWNGLHGAKVFDGTGVGGMKRKGVSNHALFKGVSAR
jgi:hypothetical protein